MAKVILAFLAFFIVAWLNARKKGTWFSSSSVLICIYTVSILFSVIDIPVNDERLILQNKYWGPAMFMVVMLFAFLGPFLFFDESKVDRIKLPNKRILDLFSTIIIILSFYSIAYFAPTVLKILQGDLGALRNALYAGEKYVEEGIWNTIASTASSFYVFALLLFFIYLSIGGSKTRIALLFISSMSNPIHVLAYVGRDGVVYWIFAFAFLYCLFRPYLSSQKRKHLKKTALYFGTILLIPFILISVGRFEDDAGTSNSIVSYLGQPFVFGTLYFGIDNPPVDPGYAFPLFYEFTGIPMPESAGRWEMGGTVSWVFGTFLKSLYSAFGGLIGLLIFCFITGFFFIRVMGKQKRTLAFSKIFIYILYFEVLGQGVFYFRQYTRGGNLFILLCLLIAITFNIIQGSAPCMYMTKVPEVNKRKVTKKKLNYGKQTADITTDKCL